MRVSEKRRRGWGEVKRRAKRRKKDAGKERKGRREKERDRDTERQRETERENSNWKTLFYKDYNLGSVKTFLKTSPC